MNIFSEKTYVNVRKPYLEAESLPPDCYTSKRFFNKEVDKIFMESWLFVCRQEKIANQGDFYVSEILGESIIIVRTKEHNIKAYHNICRHRGAKILDGKGCLNSIRCPYHSWVYDLNGKLIRAKGMEKSINFETNNNGLLTVNAEVWEGFIFINFADNPMNLLDYLGDLPQKFSSYNLRDMRCVKEREDIVKCNWKLYTEVDMEDYHAPSVHPLSIGLQVFPRQDSAGEYETTYFKHPRTVSVMSTYKGPTFPHIKGLKGKLADGTFFTMIYPSFFLVTTLDSMWWINKIPITVDRTFVRVGFCFPSKTIKLDNYNELSKNYYFPRWDLVINEDNDITERHQIGIVSKWASPGRLSFHEEVINVMNNWVLDKVLD